MTRYLSMLNTDILQFVSTQWCDILLELQEVGTDTVVVGAQAVQSR